MAALEDVFHEAHEEPVGPNGLRIPKGVQCLQHKYAMAVGEGENEQHAEVKAARQIRWQQSIPSLKHIATVESATL